MKKPISLLIPVVLGVALFTGGCKEKTKEEQILEKEKKVAALNNEISTLKQEISKLRGDVTDLGKPVAITVLSTGKFQHSIDVQSRVDAEGSVSVYPEIGGQVTNILVSAGQMVSAGQTLATLDNGAIQKQVEALKTQRDLAEEVFKRQKNLWEQKIGSEIQYLQAKANFEAVESQLKGLQAQAGMSSVKAPINGTVDMIHFKVGDIVAPGMPNMGIDIIGTNTKLNIKAEVAETYVNQVKTGAPCEIYFPDAKLTLEKNVTHAGSVISRLNRTFTVQVDLDPSTKGVHPNMSAVLKIIDYQNLSAVTAPVSVIQTDATGKKYVFVAIEKDGKKTAERREVTYDTVYNGIAEIKTGLKAGEKLISAGFQDLDTGKSINY